MAILTRPEHPNIPFDYTDDERRGADVTTVTIDTGDANLDMFLVKIPQQVLCEMAEDSLLALHKEAMKGFGGPR